MTKIVTFLLLALVFSNAEERRTWKNSTGTKSFEADFVSYDKGIVTLLKDGLTEVKISVRKLHEDDKAWVKKRLTSETYTKGVFDKLNFGDTREEVSEKLSKSEFLTTDVERTFQGRTGLNGIYTTNKKLGGLKFSLYFSWEREKLEEITLRSENRTAEEYNTDLEMAWGEVQELMTQLYGNATTKVAYPKLAELEAREEGILGTHLWEPNPKQKVLLGPAIERGKYFIIVRITPEL